MSKFVQHFGFKVIICRFFGSQVEIFELVFQFLQILGFESPNLSNFWFLGEYLSKFFIWLSKFVQILVFGGHNLSISWFSSRNFWFYVPICPNFVVWWSKFVNFLGFQVNIFDLMSQFVHIFDIMFKLFKFWVLKVQIGRNLSKLLIEGRNFGFPVEMFHFLGKKKKWSTNQLNHYQRVYRL